MKFIKKKKSIAEIIKDIFSNKPLDKEAKKLFPPIKYVPSKKE